MLIVSLHDVTPALERRIRQGWSLCAARGLRPALLVVPNWHGDWPLERHPAFVEWLLERQSEGAEIFLHGERHDEVGQSRSWREQWRALGRTKGEGEFLALGRAEAMARIERGLARLRALGLFPTGFVPPAWLAGQATWDAARELGLRVAEDAQAIHLLQAGRSLASPVVRWSSRSITRSWLSVGVAEWRWLVQRDVPIIRVALHPLDMIHPAMAVSVARALDRWGGVHRPGRYADLGDRWSSGGAIGPARGISLPREPAPACR